MYELLWNRSKKNLVNNLANKTVKLLRNIKLKMEWESIFFQDETKFNENVGIYQTDMKKRSMNGKTYSSIEPTRTFVRAVQHWENNINERQ
jgi:hypothetical protein